MTPAVSIVVASYNYGRYIGEALDSIRRQTFADWEAIIVDDGSTDNSIHVIERYLVDPRFRLMCLDHAGQPNTKNRGIRAAQGQFIAFLDADDRWHPEKLAKQVRLLTSNPRVGVCYSRRRFINPAGQPTGSDRRTMHRGNVLNAMYRDNFVCFSSSIVRRAVVDHVGGFDEHIGLAIDYEWWLRIARFYEFAYIDEPLVDYRIGHANLSRRVGERLDIVLGIMRRFRTYFDVPARLDAQVARRSLAETYRHRGIVARQDAGSGRGWLLKSLTVNPLDAKTWHALAATLAPSGFRKMWRTLRGQPDWEARLPTPVRRAA